MPHIHTEPGQHDITASAWIFRKDDGELRVLVHMHRKHGKLMQIGGHVELDETPWQTLAHEIPEESGYRLDELKILQPLADVPKITDATVHPVPVLSNTHLVGDGHYHSDYCYAFMANDIPQALPAEGESRDLRWLTPDELRDEAAKGAALKDVSEIYDFIARQVIPMYHQIDAIAYATDKPSGSLLSGK